MKCTIDVNNAPKVLFIGNETENDARAITFDLSAWVEEFGSGAAQVLIKRPGEAEAYSVLLTVEDGLAVWLPSSTDTAIAGTGEIALAYSAGTVDIRTGIIFAVIDASLATGTVPPPDLESWVEQIGQLAQDAQNAAADAEAAKDDAQAAAAALEASVAQIQTNKENIEDLQTNDTEQDRRILAAFPTDTASGSIVSFQDGADELPIKAGAIHVEPMQDLHGYDSPWPAGGGANIYDDSAKTNALIDSNGGIIATDAWYLSDYCAVPVGTTKVTLTWESTNGFFQTRLVAFDSNKAVIADSYIAFSASGTYTHTYGIPSNASFVRVNYSHIINGTEYPRNNVRLNVGSTDLGYAPYSNICPISGWTGANVEQRNKNLLRKGFSTITNGGITFTANADGTVTADGTSTNANAQAALSNALAGLPSGDYYITFQLGENAYERIRGYVWDSTVNARCATPSGTAMDFVTKNNAILIRIDSSHRYAVVCQIAQADLVVSNAVYKPMIAAADVADFTFEPYTPRTYPITFPTSAGTVYGGEIDPVAKKLTVDRAAKTGGWAREQLDSTGKCWLIGLVDGSVQYGATQIPDAITNMFSVTSLENIRSANSGCALYAGSAWIAGYGNSPDELDTILQTLTIVYKLATPIVYDLTDEHISAISTYLGNNTFWADCGDIDLTYRADPTEYINKKLAELQALVLENNG